MSVPRSQYLLATLLALLGTRGLAPDALDPWRGWVTFKQFAREVAEHPDPGVSVQLTSLPDRAGIRLYFLRQVLAPEADRLEPVGGVVCEFVFPPRDRAPVDWDAWSFDFPTFERFVDLVEQHPAFAAVLTERPIATDVYWEET